MKTTLTKLAQQLDLTDRWIRELLAKTDVPINKGSVDSERALLAIARHYKGKAEDSGSEQKAAKLRRAVAQAAREEHELAVARREFIPVDEVRRDTTRWALAIRNRLLRVPRTAGSEVGLALALPHEKFLTIEQGIEKRVIEILELLSRGVYGPPLVCPHCQAAIALGDELQEVQEAAK